MAFPWRIVGFGLGISGCTLQSPPPSDSPADTDTDTGTVPTETDTDTGTPVVLEGLSTRNGTATVAVGVSYAGVEDLLFISDSGDGVPLCDIAYTLTSTAVRDDCEGCEWAFDLVIADAQVLLDQDGLCMTIFAVDATNVDTLNGQVREYGY